VKIGIIDSGIDVTHPMFMDNTLTAPAGYPKGETALTNSKVIVARNYINLLAQPQPVLNASDEVGHGTFAAGEAAGKQVTAPLATMSGMAPGAFLGNYKVFGTPGINDLTTSAAVVAAIDAAVADGMDVMSLSLGALDYAVPSDDPEVAAIENAVAAGVVVAVAAGNDGPGTHTISSPGSAPSAITVGSVSNSRAFATQLRVTVPAPVPSNLSNISYLPGDGPSIITKIPATGAVDAQTLDDNGLACSSLPSGSLGGKIALIERGSCTFASKVNNAAAAGAAAGVRQLFPQLNALDIKSVITSTASPNLTVDGESPPTVIQAGSGLLDMGSASAAQAVFTPTNLNFGTQRYSGNLSRTRALSIKNISSTTDQYTMSIA